MQNSLNKLIERAKKATGIDIGIDGNDISKVALTLNITLPQEFVQINMLFRYDLLYDGDLLDFTADEYDWCGVIKNTVKLREKYKETFNMYVDVSKVLLLSLEESGGILMLINEHHNEVAKIISCSLYDIHNYLVNGNFVDPHDEWPSFTAFFEYLVEQEEQKLREDLS